MGNRSSYAERGIECDPVTGVCEPTPLHQELYTRSDKNSLQRTPATVRAEHGMKLIKHGNTYEGILMLLEAQKLDPQTRKRPMFERSLSEAFAGQLRTHPRVDQTFEQRPAQPLQVVQPPVIPPQDRREFKPPQTVQPPVIPGYDQRFFQPPQVVKPPQQFQLPKPPEPGLAPEPGKAFPGQWRAGQNPEKLAPPAPAPFRVFPQEVPAPAQRIEQPLPVGRFSPLDAQGRTPVESVQALLGTITGARTMTPQLRQQFESAIKNADTGTSPRLFHHQQREVQAALALKPLMAADFSKVMVDYDKEAGRVIQAMQPDKARVTQQMYDSLDKTPTLQDRQQVQKALLQLNPALKDVLNKREQYLGPENVQNLLKYNQCKYAVQSEKNQQAITRFVFALALAKNGDQAEAKLHVTQALKLNRDPELTEFWKQTAAKLGVTQDKKPALPARK